ncbi:MAG: DUF3108 domain-containing protein [Bacteroidia bacterium]|nr:DUF3108 domain-containing protein [Bacteroidia bacterium]MDW8347731.1 DUF3108 domain-containing protein [Bacteroidia bacterium]
MFFIVFLILIISFITKAQNTDNILKNDNSGIPLMDLSEVVITSDKVQPLRYLEYDAFGYGERLTYKVKYGIMSAGKVIMEVMPKPVEVSGRSCYHIVATMTTKGAVDAMYPVIDRYETYVDIDGIFPWYFKKDLSEGKFRVTEYCLFDQRNQKAYVGSTAYAVPRFSQDMISFFYFLRCKNAMDVPIGTTFQTEAFVDRKVSTIKVLYEKDEVVKTTFGKINCMKLKPLLNESGFSQFKGDMYFWITKDANHILVAGEGTLPIGSVKFVIEDAQGLKHEINYYKKRK